MVHKFSRYMKQCRRCSSIFRTTARTAKICEDCSMQRGGKNAKRELVRT